jgi:hypothetical protein
MSVESWRDNVFEIAVEKKLKVILPKPNEIFIDIDSDSQYADFITQKNEFIDNVGGIERVIAYPSKSGLPHRHIIITLNKDYTPLEQIALCYFFGSDTTRNDLAVYQAIEGLPTPICFFEKED